MELIFGTLVLVGWIIAVGLLYRNRRRVARWLNDPSLNQVYTDSRKILLKRKIEDCEEELQRIEKENNPEG